MKTILTLLVAVILAFSGSAAVFAASHGSLQTFSITGQLILADDDPAPSPEPYPAPAPSPAPGPEEPK